MRMLSQEVIDAQVLRGLEKNSQRMDDIINRHVPSFFQGVARNATGVQGGKRYRAVQNGEFSYRIYCFVKD